MKTILSFLILMAVTITSIAQVGIGTTSPHRSAQLDVASTTRGFLPPRMDSTQRNAIVSPQAGLTIYNTSNKAFECYNGAAWYTTVHYISEHYGGGIVFYVYDNGQHGLIAAPADIPANRWYAGEYKHTMAYGGAGVTYISTSVGGGSRNTILIVASQAYGDGNAYAALDCVNYTDGTIGIPLVYEDWYLPSVEELRLLQLQSYVIGGSNWAYRYWSSTEFDTNNAWVIDFGNGGFQYTHDKSEAWDIRPIRAF